MNVTSVLKHAKNFIAFLLFVYCVFSIGLRFKYSICILINTYVVGNVNSHTYASKNYVFYKLFMCLLYVFMENLENIFKILLDFDKFYKEI